MKKAEE